MNEMEMVARLKEIKARKEEISTKGKEELVEYIKAKIKANPKGNSMVNTMLMNNINGFMKTLELTDGDIQNIIDMYEKSKVVTQELQALILEEKKLKESLEFRSNIYLYYYSYYRLVGSMSRYHQ